MKKTRGRLGPQESEQTDPLPAGQHLVLGTLRRLERPATLRELAASTGLHVNTVRGHLEPLVASGSVARASAPSSGRGRPQMQYSAVGPAAAPAGELASLAVTLAKALRGCVEDPVGEAREAGRTWGRGLGTGQGDGRTQTLETLTRMNFAPEPDGSAIRLTRCPLLAAAKAEPDIVCAVHLGMVQGITQAADGPAASAELLPFAEPGACRLLLGHDA